MKVTTIRRLMGAAALAGFLAMVSPARADLKWGSVTVNSGPSVYDWQIADWIGQFFPHAGNVVASNIVIYNTACYGGDFLENFNATTGEAAGGGAFDSTSFTNTTIYSGNTAGKTTIYGKYHAGTSSAINPASNSDVPHDAGVANKAASETPQKQGANQPLKGTNSTHVLIWAGKPNSQDQTDINNVKAAYAGAGAGPNTTVTTLSGAGGAGTNGAATLDNLKSSLQTIGGQMGAGETFVFFITDHGNLETVPVAPAINVATVVNPGTTQHINITMDPGLLTDMVTDLSNSPFLTFGSQQQIATELLSLSLNNHPFTVPHINPTTTPLPGGSSSLFTYDIPVAESFFDVFVSLQDLGITLAQTASSPTTLSLIVAGSGDIAKSPEPSTGLLLLSALLITNFKRARAATPDGVRNAGRPTGTKSTDTRQSFQIRMK